MIFTVQGPVGMDALATPGKWCRVTQGKSLLFSGPLESSYANKEFKNLLRDSLSNRVVNLAENAVS